MGPYRQPRIVDLARTPLGSSGRPASAVNAGSTSPLPSGSSNDHGRLLGADSHDRRPGVGADEAHRAAIGPEKAEKPSIAIDNERVVLSWPRRLKSRRRPDISPDGFDTTPRPRLPDRRTRSGQHETDVNDPKRTSAVLARCPPSRCWNGGLRVSDQTNGCVFQPKCTLSHSTS
jgi:hypothetical protein